MKWPYHSYHVLLAILLLFLGACSGSSSSSIEITRANTSSHSAVTGQRLLFQVNTLADNPPVEYTWTASGGTIEDSTTSKYWVFWVSPEQPGTYTVTCTIRDDSGNVKTVPFSVDVSDRETKLLLSQGAIGMTKQDGVKIGGVWVSTEDNTLYYSYSGNTSLNWGGGYDIIAIQNRYDQTSYKSTTLIWAAKTGENSLTYYSNGTSASTTFDECKGITRLSIDGDVLLIGADNGLFVYDPTSNVLNATSVTSHVYDIKKYDTGIMVATDSGLYRMNDDTSTWISPQEQVTNTPTYAVLQDADGNIWSVIENSNGDKVIAVNSTELDKQPPEVIDSLDQDLFDRVWCGKYYWDGSSWHDLTGIQESIKQSMISPEGLAYLITTSGELFNW